jgi:amphi-Trp domain-containing protein
MADRDVETIRSRAKFVATLRRVADAIERKEPVRIQVAGKRFAAPAAATMSVEHEVEGEDAELELQLRWQVGDEAASPSGAKAPKRKAPARRKVAKRTR